MVADIDLTDVEDGEVVVAGEVVVLFSFAKSYVYSVAKSLAYLFADVLSYADDEARRPHLDDLAVVRHTVESGMDRQPSFAEEHLDVEGHLDVCGIHILVLQDDGVEFVQFNGCHK